MWIIYGCGGGCGCGWGVWVGVWGGLVVPGNYRQTSDISRKSHQIPKLKCLSSRLAGVFAQSIEARLSPEWRCSWSSADRRCSNYIWVVNNFIAYKGATYLRGLLAHMDKCQAVNCIMYCQYQSIVGRCINGIRYLVGLHRNLYVWGNIGARYFREVWIT